MITNACATWSGFSMFYVGSSVGPQVIRHIEQALLLSEPALNPQTNFKYLVMVKVFDSDLKGSPHTYI